MKQSIFTILSNTPLTDCVYKMVLSGDTSAITAPGQFVNIQITGKFLRRPISVCDYDGSTLTIVYKVVGKGTEILSRMVPGEKLDILTGLGNGYNLAPAGDSPVLLGGGVGVPPLYHLAKRLLAMGPEPMLKAVYKATCTSGQMSFEERMGCGFGACMGCSCKTLTGYKRICKDGPVMKKEEILWEA